MNEENEKNDVKLIVLEKRDFKEEGFKKFIEMLRNEAENARSYLPYKTEELLPNSRILLNVSGKKAITVENIHKTEQDNVYDRVSNYFGVKDGKLHHHFDVKTEN